MARLKKDHSGWRSHGLYLKYKEPTENKPKSKKDTNRWCRGRVGREHNLVRYKPVRYHWFSEPFYSYVRVKCLVCHKEMYKRKYINLPLVVEVVEIETKWQETYVPVNGKLSKQQINDLTYFY